MRMAACAGGLYSLAVALLTLSVFELASQKKKGLRLVTVNPEAILTVESKS